MKDIVYRQRNDASAWRISRFPESEDAEPVYTLESEQPHLRDYWKILVKRAPLLLVVFLMVLAVGLYLNFTATSLYTSSSTIKIEPQSPTVTGVNTGAYDNNIPVQNQGPYDYYGTQFALLESRTLAARVIRELDLEPNPHLKTPIVSANPFKRVKKNVLGSLESFLNFFRSLFSEKAEKGAAAGPSEPGVSSYSISQYLEMVDVSPVKNTRLVEVRFNTPDPEFSKTLADAHTTSFIRMILESRFELTKEARDFLDKKKGELMEKLERSEAELQDFRRAHGVVSMDKGENIVVDRMVDLNKQLTAARAERIQAESLYQVVRNKNFNHLSEVINHNLIQQLKSNIAALEAERARLSSVFTDQHPRIIEINQQIRRARRSLNHEIGTIVRGIESNYNAARAREESLQAEADRQQQLALDLKQVGVQFAVLQEEVNVNRALYEGVLKRLRETNVSNDIAVSNMQIVQRAEMALFPTLPKTSLNLIIILTMGLLLAAVMVFIVEYLDTTLHTPEEVWQAVALSTIGVVPHLSSVDSAHKPIPASSRQALPGAQKSFNGDSLSAELASGRNQLSIVAESYRSIRTALMLSRAEKPPQVILLTSPCPGDGKTVTALNLGIVLAQGGHKVLVIDADLRKGRCHKLLGLSNGRGLSNLLTGHLSLEQSIQKTPVEGLSLLSRGALPPNPADLLCSRKMQEVLTLLRQSYDFVLIDSPPVNAVSDPALLSAVCDGILVVLHGRQTTADSARRAVENLGRSGTNIIGAVLNGVDLRNPDYKDFRSYYPPYAGSTKDKEELLDEGKVIGTWSGFTEEKGPTSLDSGALPKAFMDHLIATLGKAVGPKAPAIVRDNVAALGHSLESFPRKKLDMLIFLLSQEISDGNLKREFHWAVSDRIRTLDTF